MGRFVCHEVPDGEETELENCSSNWDQCETNNSTVGFPLHMSISQSAGSSTRRTGQSQWPSEMRRFEFVGDHLQQDNPNLNSFSNSVQPHSNTGRNQEIERLYHERPNHHLYDCDFNNNFEQHESNIKNTRRNYMKHICFLAILLIFQRYIPPPPPPNQSWTEFVARSTETCVSTAQMVANLVMYVSCGCVQNMYRDYSHHFAMESNENSASSCSIALPLLRSNHDDNQTSIVSTEEHDNHLHYLMEKLTSNIAAQDIVLKNIVRNLKDWNDNEYTAKDESERRALSVMLTGPRGVGKYETALSLANMLLEQCQDYINMNSDSISHRILTLDGMDYVLDEDNANVQRGLVRRILDHIYSHRGTGTVIIIKHLENISSRKKQELMHLIHQTKIMYTPKRSITQDTQTTSMRPNNWNVNNLILGKHDEDSKSIDLSLGGSAIIATSDLGTDKIFEVLLKKSKGVHDDLTYKAIEKAVGLEVANYYDENTFNIFAPFWPLRYWDMGKVLNKVIQKKIDYKNYRYIEVLDSAARHLTNPQKIHYLEIKLSDGSYLFSKNGAHDLVEYQSIVTKINDMISTKSFHTIDDKIVVEYNGNSLSMKVCSDPTYKICSPITKMEDYGVA